MKTILVTGASGQLGKCLQKIGENHQELDWLFMDSSDIDITSKNNLDECFNSKSIDFCVNCAAYTNVERAESEPELAYEVNSKAVKHLAEVCLKNDTVLIHISTDYVFNGKAFTPYLETDDKEPLNVYGASKLAGEQHIQKILNKYFIFRTSWLYSQFGHNFYNTILRKAAEGAELNITSAQHGTPTNANDLARCIVKVISKTSDEYGMYHFSNEGETTWYGFAREILEVSGQKVMIKEDNSYKTIATRPVYSVLNKEKLKNKLDIFPDNWENAVKELYFSQIKG